MIRILIILSHDSSRLVRIGQWWSGIWIKLDKCQKKAIKWKLVVLITGKNCGTNKQTYSRADVLLCKKHQMAAVVTM